MRRVALILTATLFTTSAALLSGPANAVPCVSWANTATSGNWGDAANWSTAAVPTNADAVCLPAGTYTVTVAADAAAKNVTIASGGPVLDVDATLTVNLGAGPLTLNGGVLTGVGTVAGNVTNNAGAVRPGDGVGTLSVGGFYTQTTTGALDIEIAGSTAGQYDVLAVGGELKLEGALVVDATALPSPGVHIVTAGSVAATLTNPVVGGVPASWVGGSLGTPGFIVTAHQDYSDVPLTQTFILDIAWASSYGIVTGYPDNTFRPTANLNRQSLVVMLYRQQGSPDGPDPSCAAAPFPDVPVTNTFCGEIKWASDNHIVSGQSDGRFHPSDVVMRQAVAAMLYRLAGSPNGPTPTCSTNPFSDVHVGQTFCGEIKWASDNHIVNGYSGGTFRPTRNVTRQEITAFLHRYSQLG